MPTSWKKKFDKGEEPIEIGKSFKYSNYNIKYMYYFVDMTKKMAKMWKIGQSYPTVKCRTCIHFILSISNLSITSSVVLLSFPPPSPSPKPHQLYFSPFTHRRPETKNRKPVGRQIILSRLSQRLKGLATSLEFRNISCEEIIHSKCHASNSEVGIMKAN